MFIQNNIINNYKYINDCHHAASCLYGKPRGTFFFREHSFGKIQLVVSAGRTKIAVLSLYKNKEGIIIDQTKGKVNELFFKTELDFEAYIRSNELIFSEFPNDPIKLKQTVYECNSSVKSLQEIAAIVILKNDNLREKAFEIDNENKTSILLTEDLCDYLLEVDEQLEAERALANELRRRK